MTAATAHLPPHHAGTESAWLLGHAPLQRRGIKLLRLAVYSYAFACGLLAIGAWNGKAPVQPVAWVIGYVATGLLLFYAALRSGLSLKTKDPTLSFARVLFGVGAITLAYGTTELARGATLMLLGLLLVFDMQRLTPAQIRVATVSTAVLICSMLGWMAAHPPPGLRLRHELMNVAMMVLMLPVLSLVAREVRRLGRKQEEQRIELACTLERLRELSTRDSLTGIHNRRHMQALLQQELQRRARSGTPFCVALLDLDHFKRINDSHGHAVGDAVLRDFAHLMRDAMRQTDAAGRWGGEEFLLLLHDADLAHASQALERLRSLARTHDWAQHAHGLQVSASGGLAEHHPGETPEQLLERADRALYRAKADGRGRVVAAQGLA